MWIVCLVEDCSANSRIAIDRSYRTLARDGAHNVRDQSEVHHPQRAESRRHRRCTLAARAFSATVSNTG